MKVELTDTLIQSVDLQGKKNLKLTDTQQSGFGVQLTAAARGSYFIRCKVPSPQGWTWQQQSIGSVSELTVAQARLKATELLAAHRAHLQTDSQVQALQAQQDQQRQRGQALKHLGVGQSWTVRDFFYERYLPHLQAQGSKWKTHDSIYRNHLDPTLGSLRLQDVTKSHVLSLREALMAKPRWGGEKKRHDDPKGKISQGTVNRAMILLRHLFNVALQTEEVPGLLRNPTQDLKLDHGQSKVLHGQILRPEEVDRLVQVAHARCPVFGFQVALMALTGLRRGNVLNLRWEWIDFPHRVLSIPQEESKSKQAMVKVLSDQVFALIEGWANKVAADGGGVVGKMTGPVFQNPKTGKPYTSRRSIWESVREEAGFPDLRMHDLRHTFAVTMIEAGMDVTKVQKALGHSQLKTTSRYLNYSKEHQRLAEEAVCKKLQLDTTVLVKSEKERQDQQPKKQPTGQPKKQPETTIWIEQPAAGLLPPPPPPPALGWIFAEDAMALEQA